MGNYNITGFIHPLPHTFYCHRFLCGRRTLCPPCHRLAAITRDSSAVDLLGGSVQEMIAWWKGFFSYLHLMSQRGTIRRYTLILEKVNGKQFPSAQEIRDYLEDIGLTISKRTLERDFDAIRNEFGIEITYDKLKNGYYIDTDKSIAMDSFIRFLEIVNTADLLTESLSDSKEALSYIHFDKGGGMKGIELLRPILRAIKDQNEISFTHFSFQTEKRRKYKVHPYLLKEYQNRWYITGLVSGMKQFRTFGLDRIEELTIHPSTFHRDPSVDLNAKFNDAIGVVYKDGQKEEVILSFDAEQANYIKSLPLHHSQETLLEDENELRIRLFVVINYELIQ
jgi:proteasome accessory factor B